MKQILKSALITCSFVFAMTSLTSCGTETGPGLEDPTGTEEYGANIPEDGYKVEKEITATPNEIVKFAVNFSGSEKKMDRLYISQNVWGSSKGTVAYDINEQAPAADTKKDGSLDLDGEEKTVYSKTLPLKAPSQAGGVVVYKIWPTAGALTAKGDFRDYTKRNAYGEKNPALITVKITAGNASASATGMKVFTKKIFAAPASDGSSKSFISAYNGQLYKINEAKESVALWDFGYYYLNSTGATFESAFDYRDDIVDVVAKSDVERSQLNKCYFKKSNSTTFDNASASSLGELQVGTTQKIEGLEKNDVIAFKDAYGAKGLIKVTDLKKGMSPTNDYIEITIKVQDLSVKN